MSIKDQQNEAMEIASALGEDYKDIVGEMSFDEIQDLFSTTEEERSESSKKLSKLPSNTNSVLEMPTQEYLDSIKESKNMYEGIATQATVSIDPVTGLQKITDTGDTLEIADRSISELVDINNPDTNNIKDTLSGTLGSDLSDPDIIEILTFMRTVEQNPPKKLYNILPRAIKEVIDSSCKSMPQPDIKEIAAREFYNMIYSELRVDKEFLELDEMIKKEMDLPDIADMYLDYIKDIMEQDLLKKADIVESQSEEKAEILRKMSAAFTDSYTYETLRRKIGNKKSIINKQLTKELKDYDKYCLKINAMYKHSNFIIVDTRSLLYILDRKLPEDIHIDSIKKFIILLFQICRNKDISKIEDHTYIYYSTKLIQALDHIDSPKTDMSTTIVQNITDIIRLIEE